MRKLIYTQLTLTILLSLSLISAVSMLRSVQDILPRLTGKVPFQLNIPNANYQIQYDEPLGMYAVEVLIDEKKHSILVGSSQLPLDNFVGKIVRIEGEVRPILGAPNCQKKCEGNYRAPVLDIKNVHSIE